MYIPRATGKNRKERVLEAVKRTKGAMRFGPALQTTDQQTLRNIKRSNISETILMEMAGAAMELGQRSYTELILGLPGDTIPSHLGSIRAAMEAGMQRIKMYPLVLLPGTEMASATARREFGLQTCFRVFPQCHGSYRFLQEPFPSVEVGELVISTNSMTQARQAHQASMATGQRLRLSACAFEEGDGTASPGHGRLEHSAGTARGCHALRLLRHSAHSRR